MIRIWNRFQSPAMVAGVWWLVSVVATAVVFELGDFGIPWWMAATCFLWVFTLGFPTFLTFIATAWLWGNGAIPLGIPPFAFFLICVAVLSFALHRAAFFLLFRWTKSWRTR